MRFGRTSANTLKRRRPLFPDQFEAAHCAQARTKDTDDGAQAGPLLDQVEGSVASFVGDGGYDRKGVYAEVAARHPDAAVVVPPRVTAVPGDTAETAPSHS